MDIRREKVCVTAKLVNFLIVTNKYQVWGSSALFMYMTSGMVCVEKCMSDESVGTTFRLGDWCRFEAVLSFTPFPHQISCG